MPSRRKKAIDRRKSDGLLSGPQGQAFLADLKSLLALPRGVLGHLERLADAEQPDPDQVSRAYFMLPGSASQALSFAMRLSEADLERVSAELGSLGVQLRNLREKLIRLRGPIMALQDRSQGQINVWRKADHNALYDFLRHWPVVEMWLYDSGGAQILYSRADADDFVNLAEVVLSVAARSIKAAADARLSLPTIYATKLVERVQAIQETATTLVSTLRSARSDVDVPLTKETGVRE